MTHTKTQTKKIVRRVLTNEQYLRFLNYLETGSFDVQGLDELDSTLLGKSQSRTLSLSKDEEDALNKFVPPSRASVKRKMTVAKFKDMLRVQPTQNQTKTPSKPSKPKSPHCNNPKYPYAPFLDEPFVLPFDDIPSPKFVDISKLYDYIVQNKLDFYAITAMFDEYYPRFQDVPLQRFANVPASFLNCKVIGEVIAEAIQEWQDEQ